MPQTLGQQRADDEHPFLTPKGLRLLRGNKKQAPLPMEFPEYPSFGESVDGVRQADCQK